MVKWNWQKNPHRQIVFTNFPYQSDNNMVKYLSWHWEAVFNWWSVWKHHVAGPRQEGLLCNQVIIDRDWQKTDPIGWFFVCKVWSYKLFLLSMNNQCSTQWQNIGSLMRHVLNSFWPHFENRANHVALGLVEDDKEYLLIYCINLLTEAVNRG